MTGQSLFRSRARSPWDLASLAIVCVLLVVGAHITDEFAVTWDELFHIHYGQAILDYYATWGSDREALTYRSNFLYGGAFDVLGAWLINHGPWGRFIAWHLGIFACALLGWIGAWRLGRLLGGPRAGFFSLCALVLHPIYFGHAFNNPKDLPFATGYIWALHAIVWMATRYPRVRRVELAWAGLLIGMAMSVRIAGLLALVYGLAAMVVALALHHWSLTSSSLRRRAVQRFFPDALIVTAAAWLTMISTWPWAIESPLRRPIVAVQRMTYFAHHDRKMPFAGRTVKISDSTPEYIAHYLGLKTPEFVLALFALSVPLVLVALVRVRRGRLGPNLRAASLLLVLGATVFPPVYAVFKGSNLYDGMRHFLFIVPPMTVLAGFTLDQVWRGVQRVSGRRVRAALTLSLGGACAMVGGYHLALLVRLHPVQSVYFNHMSGGIPAAYENYDIDYYASSYGATMELLQRELWNRERDRYLEGPYVVTGCWLAAASHLYAPQNFVARRQRDRQPRADFFMGYTRNNCHKKHSQHPVYARLRREGGTVTVIRDVRDKPQKAKGSSRTQRRPADKPRARPQAGDAATLPPPASTGTPRGARVVREAAPRPPLSPAGGETPAPPRRETARPTRSAPQGTPNP